MNWKRGSDATLEMTPIYDAASVRTSHSLMIDYGDWDIIWNKNTITQPVWQSV